MSDTMPDTSSSAQHRLGQEETTAAIAFAQQITDLPTPTPDSPWEGSHAYRWRISEMIEVGVLGAVGLLSLAVIIGGTNRELGYFGILALPLAILVAVVNVRRKRASYRAVTFDGTTLHLLTRTGDAGRFDMPEITRILGKNSEHPHVLDISVKAGAYRSVAVPHRLLTIKWLQALMLHTVKEVERNSRAEQMVAEPPSGV